MCITIYVNTVTALVLNWLVCEYNIVPYNLCVGAVTEPWNQYAQHTVKSTFESYLPHMWSVLSHTWSGRPDNTIYTWDLSG